MYERLRGLTAEFVRPLEVGGLHGRMFEHPSRRADGGGRTIVFVYGIHASLERFYGVIHFFARFGRVVAPDLPGFGGMEPFYAKGRRPSLDAYGDYLAEFIAQELPDGKLTLVGLSYGFVVMTRMLARHPELQPRVSLTVSAMGLADGRDLGIKPWLRWLGQHVILVGGTWQLGAVVAQWVLTRPMVLKWSYGPNHPKMRALEPAVRPGFIAFEAHLWQTNDMRTYCACLQELFGLRAGGKRVELELQHIETTQDHSR